MGLGAMRNIESAAIQTVTRWILKARGNRLGRRDSGPNPGDAFPIGQRSGSALFPLGLQEFLTRLYKLLCLSD